MRELTITDILTIGASLLLCLLGMTAWAARVEILAWVTPRRAYLVPFGAVVGGAVVGGLAGGWWPLVGALLGAAIVGFFRPSHPLAYVTHDDEADDERGDFPHSRPEAEAEVGRKLAPGSADGMLVITQAAHEAQLDEAFEDGMIKAFAAMQKGGYLVPGKATEVKRLLFGVGGGRALQSLNRAIDAVAVELAAPDESPERVTPLAGRPIASDLEFAGQVKA